MPLKFVTGDLFESKADILVNAVNCSGVMGKGIAKEFKKRYPEMYLDYREACKNGAIVPGKVHAWHGDKNIIVSFPTKRHWKDKSLYEDIELGLIALRSFLCLWGEAKVAMPALGCGEGKLEWVRIRSRIRKSLSNTKADISVYSPLEKR